MLPRFRPPFAAAVVLVAAVASMISTAVPAVEEPTRESILLAAREIAAATPFCALITVDESGAPAVREMHPFAPEPDFTVWLGTRRGTRKVGQIRRHPEVALYFQADAGAGYATLVGRATIVTDPEERARRWKPEWKAFYDDENRGEDYLLIRVEPRRLEVVSAEHGIASEPKAWRPAVVDFEIEPP